MSCCVMGQRRSMGGSGCALASSSVPSDARTAVNVPAAESLEDQVPSKNCLPSEETMQVQV
eukprot:CAMPEP_0183571278 /NCGR_PEP_ID=MMETSP0371-20130417/125678_1 /TAXON_ID=268820 /ORGANISM="Peridinium aciculiferum, Strain PAER-2" /LENGTH=60 /DNA_ID=CAMNT_0025781043 /DNA_START=51 /DNA_END=233 /DNA_ORIENTATION=+